MTRLISWRNALLTFKPAPCQIILCFTTSKKRSQLRRKLLQNLDVIKSKLSIAEDVRFERVHRVDGKFSRNGERRIRPIVAQFSEFKMKEKVRKNAFRLAGTDVGIAEQFPPEIQAKGKELWPIMEKAKQDGKRASMVKGKLYIDGTLYRPTV